MNSPSAKLAKQRRSGIYFFKHGLRSLLVRTRLCRFLKIRIQDYVINFHAAAIPGAFFVNPNDRVQDYLLLKALLRPGDNYVDVGANVGTTVIPAAKAVGPSGRVWAFEPHPRIVSYLKENLVLNGLRNVEVRQCAVDAEAGTVNISDFSSDDMNSIVQDSTGGILVQSYRLDELLPSSAPIALLKIDVEGAEIRVMSGAKLVLARTSAVYIEVGDSMLHRMGTSAEQLVALLLCAGFQIFRVQDGRELSKITLDELTSKNHSNVLALRNPEEAASRLGLMIKG